MAVYFKKFFVFSAILAIILIMLGFIEVFKPVMSFVWLCYALFFIMSFITFYISAKNMHGKFSNFMNIFFAGIFLKLIVTSVVIMLYKYAHSESVSVYLIACITIIYFYFLAFETVQLVKLSRRKA